jgi:uncharacterized protein
MKLPRQNTETEIEAFSAVCDRLGGFDERLSAEWVDGYLSALAAGPVVVAMEDWLPRLAGDAYDRAFSDPEDRQQAERALHARMAVLRDQLDAESLFDDPDALRLAPLMLEWNETLRAEAVAEGEIEAEHAGELVTGAVWADGFFDGLAEYSEDWPSNPDEEQAALFDDLMHQVNVLRLEEGSAELREHVAERYGAEGADRSRLVDAACYAVQDLRLWWVDQAPKPETRRVEKAPGRNDPCPCGSGKKFKKCHGAA